VDQLGKWHGAIAAALIALALAGCSTQAPPTRAGAPPVLVGDDAHLPPFARIPYEPFSRDAAVQIARREWRAFGSPVLFPDQELPYDAERSQGFWQRVGEYWWLGLPLGDPEQAYTGMHTQYGTVFPASLDGNYAWSAVFIDYVMRMAGAGHAFPYSANHSDYINAAKEHALGQRPDMLINAERPETYAPQVGDLICFARGMHPLRYDDLPAGRFPGHCQIVVATHPGAIDSIGGNISNTVGMWRTPVTADGKLAGPDGRVLDPLAPWFVVIRVLYPSIGNTPAAPLS
jgi:hypothetical protein